MKLIFILILFILKGFALSAQTASIEVIVTNIQPLQGKIMVALFDSKETYFDIEQMYAGFEIPVDSSEVDCAFHDLPVGIYAITIYMMRMEMATDLGLATELLKKNECGLIFPPTDYTAWEKAFGSVIKGETIDIKVIDRQKVVEVLDIEIRLREWLSMFQEVINNFD